MNESVILDERVKNVVFLSPADDVLVLHISVCPLFPGSCAR